MPNAALSLSAQLAEKQTQLKDFFKGHETGMPDRPYAMTPQERDQVKAWMAECDDIGAKRDEASELETMAEKVHKLGEDMARPVGRPFANQGKTKGEARGFGDVVCGALFDKGGKYKGKTEAEVEDFGFLEMKTTMTSTGGFPAEARRSGRLDLSIQAPIVLTDMLPTIPVSMGTYTYMRETTFTNAATGIAEAATYPESALAYTPVTATITKIGTFIPVTEEQLSDVDGMRALIDNRLRLMVGLEVENEVLNGDGTANKVNGYYNQVTQTQAVGTDPVFDAVLKAATKVRTVGMANPDMVVLHPNDFQDIRLTRTTDGIYIMGNPDQVGLERLFGMRTTQALKASENTGLVGDFGTHSALLTRWGLEVTSSNSDGTDFVKDIIKVKARVRLGLAIFRLTAFCEITGM